MSSLRKAKPSPQQVLEVIQQTSYCPSGFDSSGSFFPSTDQHPCSPISCDLDVGRVWRPSLFCEYWCLLFCQPCVASGSLHIKHICSTCFLLTIMDYRLGASSHMTETSSLLSSYHPTPSHPPVTIADGRSCLVQGRDTTRVTPSLSLHQILYVPGFPVNLFSISAITLALLCTVAFFPFHYIFQDLYTGRRIGLGRENGRGIYELVVDELSLGLQALFGTSTATSSLLWHRRLGHPCFDKLKKTLPWLSLTQFVCESCQLGKHYRSSYSSRNGIPSSAPFDLLHCDVWGPSHTLSISGHRYYIMFVDDYTRVSWVYLLCDRSEVVTIVTHFITKVITQYSITLKIIHTDIALEFVQTSLRTFCVDRGIIYQTTYPHTSQQNGIAERKHRQLLDITCTLLIKMHVPSYLWSDALMTATYLQNRLPSAPLDGAIPLHRLLPTSSLFSLLPRVFGYIAFVQDHSPSLYKLAPRALKGVFVIYSRTQRATRCTFLTLVIIWPLPMLPFMRTLSSYLLPRFLWLLPLHLLCLASLPWWSLLIPVIQFPLLHSLSLLSFSSCFLN